MQISKKYFITNKCKKYIYYICFILESLNTVTLVGFAKEFKTELVVHSPGRINFIGEHTDYNNGFVMPTAIDKKIIFSFQKNDSNHICAVYSSTYDKMLNIDLNQLRRSSEEWENYILGG